MSNNSVLQKLYPDINIEMIRAIVGDVIEINLGLDYKSIESLSDDQIYSLYNLMEALFVINSSNSNKAKLLNIIRTMSEDACTNLLNYINNYE